MHHIDYSFVFLLTVNITLCFVYFQLVLQQTPLVKDNPRTNLMLGNKTGHTMPLQHNGVTINNASNTLLTSLPVQVQAIDI